MSKLITLKNDKEINIVNKINDFKAPEKVYIPITTKEELKINDYIYKYSIISNNISPISGSISGIEKLKNNKERFYIIQNDYKENIKIKPKKEKVKNLEDLLNLLNKYNLNNIANKITNVDTINNLVISSIDEEFYSAKEFMRLANNYREILETIDLLMNIFNINKSLLVVKNTNFKSIKNVKSIIGTYPNINITLAPDKYLIGEPTFLYNFLNIKNNESLVLSTTDIYDIYNILNGKYITDTLITIAGNGINKSLVINVKVGVCLKDIIKEYIKITCDDYEIFINGYLRGKKITNIEDIIIDKSIYVIVINKKEIKEITDCINCGACNKICPYNINVKRCYLKKLNHKKCINCGLCNYICPANINLKEIVKSD